MAAMGRCETTSNENTGASAFRPFKSQDCGRPIYKHRELPVYVTDQFNFYRCVEFKPGFYGRTASVLFNDNLRECAGRYSKLFPGQKLSYWADSPRTARAEIKKHDAGNDILTFWAYDDAASTFPTLPNRFPLKIIDGRKCGVQELIDKADGDVSLSATEEKYMVDLLEQEPDCLAFDSHARKGGENFIFFEKGFRKLALRQISLRFGRSDGGNHNRVVCAETCDYSPSLESYGEYFVSKARVRMDETYLKSDEYLLRKRAYEDSLRKYRLTKRAVGLTG